MSSKWFYWNIFLFVIYKYATTVAILLIVLVVKRSIYQTFEPKSEHKRIPLSTAMEDFPQESKTFEEINDDQAY